MQEINLYDLIKYYAKQWRVIVWLTLLGLVAGLTYNTFIQKPLYKSDTKLILVSTPAKPTASDPTLINNYIDLIKSRRVLDPIIEKEHSTLSYDTLSQSVQATNQKNTQVIEVIVTTQNAEQSKSIANDISQSFMNAVTNLYHNDNVVVVDPAVAASGPSNVHTAMQLAASTIIGLFISIVALFFIYDYRQSKVRNSRTKRAISRTNKQPVIVAKVSASEKVKPPTTKKKPTTKSSK